MYKMLNYKVKEKNCQYTHNRDRIIALKTMWKKRKKMRKYKKMKKTESWKIKVFLNTFSPRISTKVKHEYHESIAIDVSYVSIVLVVVEELSTVFCVHIKNIQFLNSNFLL